MSAAGGRHASPAPRTAPADEHRRGFSSLALLAGSGPSLRTAYLLSWSEAILTMESVDAPPRWISIRLDGWDHLPLADGAVDLAVADLDAVPPGRNRRRAAAGELRRILTAQGRVVAVVSHRRRPRDLRNWSRYRLVPPSSAWRRAFTAARLHERQTSPLSFDGDRLTAIQLRAHERGDSAEAMAMVLVRSGTPPGTLIEDVERAVARELGDGVSLGRIHVRKIGKNAAFTGSRAGPIVVRIPRSVTALDRARRAHAALEWMRRFGPRSIHRLAPQPLGHGRAGIQPWFVESALDGRPREDAVAAPRWEPQALRFITELHAATAERALLSDAWFEREIEEPLRAIEAVAGSGAGASSDWLRRTLRSQLVGREMPLVRSHGDFTGSNCLYDRDGRLSGVVDWELSREDALPLLDLLQSIDLPAEHASDGRWLRSELILDAAAGRGPLDDAAEIREYTQAIGVDRQLVTPLLLMHWIDHVGARVAVRRSDARWVTRRLLSPLARMAQLAAGGGFRGSSAAG